MILQMREYLTIKTKGDTTRQPASRCSGQNYEGTDTDSSCPLTRERLGDTGLLLWHRRMVPEDLLGDVQDQPGKQRKSLAQIELKQINK